MYEFAPPSFMKSQQLKDEEALIYFFRDLKCRVLGRKCADIEKFIVSK